MARYWSGICPVCGEGRLFVMKQLGNGVLVLLCEECFVSWNNPDAVAASECKEGLDLRVVHATEADLRNAGWGKYTLHLSDG